MVPAGAWEADGRRPPTGSRKRGAGGRARAVRGGVFDALSAAAGVVSQLAAAASGAARQGLPAEAAGVDVGGPNDPGPGPHFDLTSGRDCARPPDTCTGGPARVLRGRT